MSKAWSWYRAMSCLLRVAQDNQSPCLVRPKQIRALTLLGRPFISRAYVSTGCSTPAATLPSHGKSDCTELWWQGEPLLLKVSGTGWKYGTTTISDKGCFVGCRSSTALRERGWLDIDHR